MLQIYFAICLQSQSGAVEAEDTEPPKSVEIRRGIEPMKGLQSLSLG